jgi:hypothetical protein
MFLITMADNVPGYEVLYRAWTWLVSTYKLGLKVHTQMRNNKPGNETFYPGANPTIATGSLTRF